MVSHKLFLLLSDGVLRGQGDFRLKKEHFLLTINRRKRKKLLKHQDDEIDAIVEEAKKLLLQATYVELPKGSGAPFDLFMAFFITLKF